MPGDLFVEPLEQRQQASLRIRQRAGRDRKPVLAQRTADRTQRTVLPEPLRQNERPDGHSVSGIRKHPLRGRTNDLLFLPAGAGRAQPMSPNMPNIGDDPVLEDVRLVVAVRDPGLAAVIALAIVRDRILLADGQVRKRRAAVRRRSRTAPPASAGGHRRPLAAAPVQIPGEPAVAGFHVLYAALRSFRPRQRRSLGQRPVALSNLPGENRVLPEEGRVLPVALSNLPEEGRVLPVALSNLPEEGRVLPVAPCNLPEEGRVLPKEGHVLPEQRRKWSLAVARQLGSEKCACRFEHHGVRIQELKSGFQLKILPGWTGRSARETLRHNLLPGYLSDVARRRRTRSRKSGRTRNRSRLLKKTVT